MEYADLQAKIASVVVETHSVEIRRWEASSTAEAVAGLVPQIEACGWRALEVLDEFLADDDGDNDLFAETPQVGSSKPAGVQEVGEIAFIARWDLRRRVTQLGSLDENSELWSVIALCSAIRRHVCKACTEVERALCRALGLRSQLEELSISELGIALATRRAYLAFVRDTRATEDRLVRGEIRHDRALRSTSSNLAKIVGRDVYEDMRVEDRKELRALQARILSWGRGELGGDLGARRLWLDASAVAELLLGVQQREVLREHDHALCGEALDELRGGRIAAGLLRRLGELEGRDPDVAELVASGETGAERWRPVIERIYARLSDTLGSDPSPAEFSEQARA